MNTVHIPIKSTSHDRYSDMINWCINNLGFGAGSDQYLRPSHPWCELRTARNHCFSFLKEDDATLFKLTWA